MPAMDLVCLFLPSSDPRQDTFQIAIDSNEFVDQLRALIVSRVPSLDLAHASKLRLWKCVIPKNNDLEVALTSVTLNPADALDPDALVVDIFTDTDLPKKRIHILVQNKGECEPLNVLSLPEVQNATPPADNFTRGKLLCRRYKLPRTHCDVF